MVGDMGKKLGQNVLDNGFTVFHNVQIPLENLLNKTGDVTPEGHYVTPFKDPNKRFGASLGDLLGGRVPITRMGVINLKLAMTIEIRYSATRRQFGPKENEEIPVLEYQMQALMGNSLVQWRLVPYLAAVLALDHFSKTLFVEFQIGLMMKDKTVPLAAYKWLVCFLLQESYKKLNREKTSGKPDSEARNNNQVYYCCSLAIAFIEHTVLQRFHDYTPCGLSTLIWMFYAKLKDDVVALVDVIAPPDFILNSPIGKADGEIYKNLCTAVLQGSKVLERPYWWTEFCANKPTLGSLRAKL
ncbi:Peroxisomal acyl-coenzyme A oxidase 3 [Acipenser ruthenus]|uniref:Peroxisomal acyl-coenzyme A oxidase 3 n=1 Tax=Acipenser ruthenus TaxID=7906 RepID=A0A444UMD9_ACIRT|nr:Peroxisomal acyl-coenzyme A oxidase 3 [Acipenser ruthenus]